MASFTETLSLIIDAKTGGAIRDVNQLGTATKGLGDNQTATAGKTGFLQGKLNDMGVTGAAAGGMIATALGTAAVAGVAALTKFALDGVKAQVALADSVRKVSVASGLSAEQASRLVEVSGDYGIEVGTVEKAMLRFGLQTQKNEEIFRSHNVAIERNKDGTVDLEGTLVNVQKAFKATGDETERNRILTDLFGKAGKDLIPILGETKDLKQALADVDAGRILNEDDLQQARDYQLAMDGLGDALDTLQRSLGQALIPMLTEFAVVLSESLSGINDLAGAVGGLDNVVSFAWKSFSPLSLGMGVAGGAAKALDGDFSGAAESIVRGTGLIGNTFASVTGLFGGAKEETNKLTDAQKRYAEASRELNDAAVTTGTTTKELTALRREETAAERELEGVTNDVADALETENEAARTAIDLGNQRLNATAGLLGADLNLAEAKEKVFIAYAKVAEIEAAGKTGTQEHTEAIRDAQRADIALVQSKLAVDEAVKKLTEQAKSGEISMTDYQAQLTKIKESNPDLAHSVDVITFATGMLHGKIDALPERKYTFFYGDGTHLNATMDAAERRLHNLGQFAKMTPEQMAALLAANFVVQRKVGGPIPGAVNDAVPIIAHGGEYVLSADVVSRIKNGRPSFGARSAQPAGASFAPAMPSATTHGENGTPSAGTTLVIPLVIGGRAMTEVVVSELNRSGGPKISQRAVV
jgi:hypothetical protein